MNNFRQKADLIWSLANILRHDYKPHEYADVILPLVVLRRLDQAMEPTRAAGDMSFTGDASLQTPASSSFLLKTPGCFFCRSAPISIHLNPCTDAL